MPVTRVNGVGLYWQMQGPAGEPLVMVHGSWGDHDNWAPVVPALAEHYRVVTYDRRGHSQSERPAGQGSIHEDADDLAALIETLGLAPAHVAGNSGGSAVALRLAARRPELFRTLAVHEPATFLVLVDDPDAREALAHVDARVRAVVDLLAAGEDEAGARLFVETIAFGPGGWDQIPPPLRATFVRNAPTFLDETRDPDSIGADLVGLRGFDRPALLSTSDDSPVFFRRVIEKFAGVLPQARVHTFTGAGHVPHLRQPAEYVRVVRQFLATAGVPA